MFKSIIRSVFGKAIGRVSALSLVVVFTLSVFMIGPVAAQTESTGCAAANAGSFDLLNSYGGTPFSGTFFAGESIRVNTIGNPSYTSWTNAYNLSFTLNSIFQGSVPSPYTYTIPSDGTYTFYFSEQGRYYTQYFFTCTAVDHTVYPPDSRINWQYGDLAAVLYRNIDNNGNPMIDTYCWDGDNSWLGMRSDSSSASGTSADICDVTFYILSDGSYQFNINYDGKQYEIRCADFDCTDPDMTYYDPNE